VKKNEISVYETPPNPSGKDVIDVTTNASLPNFTVFVDDNFHFMDEGAREELASFSSPDEAEAACREIVDAFLTSHWKRGMTAKELFRGWLRYGESPTMAGFGACRYAKERCAQLCKDADEAKRRKQVREAQKERWRRLARGQRRGARR
jgi:hypothetical protein